jgi:hypothetical protein
MKRKVLCPKCGTTNVVTYNPWPGSCTACKSCIPFTLPRTVAYTMRSIWRPLAIGAALLIVLIVTPNLTREDKTGFIQRITNAFTTPHQPPTGLRSPYPDTTP